MPSTENDSNGYAARLADVAAKLGAPVIAALTTDGSVTITDSERAHLVERARAQDVGTAWPDRVAKLLDHGTLTKRETNQLTSALREIQLTAAYVTLRRETPPPRHQCSGYSDHEERALAYLAGIPQEHRSRVYTEPWIPRPLNGEPRA